MAANNSITTYSPKVPFKVARYAQAIGQVIPDTTNIDVSWEINLMTDTHVTQTSAVLFTINEDGFYQIDYTIRIGQSGTAANAQFNGSGLAINGITLSQGAHFTDIGSPTTGTMAHSQTLDISYTARLSAGDTVVGWARNNNFASASRSLVTSQVYNHITFTKMGD